MSSESFPRACRLTRRADFLRVQRGGRRLHLAHFVIYMARQPTGVSWSTRIGVTVTRKVAGAVGRNRIKRLVREVFRRGRTGLPAGLDVVWVAKRNASEVAYCDVERGLATLGQRLAAGVGGG
ncbi:MAG: ribonuclease P protein component [Nannocystaceae bacterium]